MVTMASQITSLTIVYSTVYSGADQRKHQSSASLAFVRGIHRGSVNSPHKWPVTRKMFPFDDVIMKHSCFLRSEVEWLMYVRLYSAINIHSQWCMWRLWSSMLSTYGETDWFSVWCMVWNQAKWISWFIIYCLYLMWSNSFNPTKLKIVRMLSYFGGCGVREDASEHSLLLSLLRSDVVASRLANGSAVFI